MFYIRLNLQQNKSDQYLSEKIIIQFFKQLNRTCFDMVNNEKSQNSNFPKLNFVKG